MITSSLFQIIILFVFSIFSFTKTEEKSYSHVDAKGIPFDQKLIQLMDYKKGTFVEVGAYDGLIQSNTKRLEEYYEWTGILVEPSENVFLELILNRPDSNCFQCALGSFEEDNTYVAGDFNNGLMSSIGGVRLKHKANNWVLVRSLQSILDEVGLNHINFLSLDTEGYELNILKGIDFSKTKFDYMLIEIYPSQYEDIVIFLSQYGYELIENFSNYNTKDNPLWDGLHNDYLFKRRDLLYLPE